MNDLLDLIVLNFMTIKLFVVFIMKITVFTYYI